MLEAYAFCFDERASRPGRVVLKLGPASTPNFESLEAAIFKATTRMGLQPEDRDLLAIAPMPGMPLQPVLRAVGPALETHLLGALDRFTLVALSVGAGSRQTFRVLGNRLLLPSGDRRRVTQYRVTPNPEHAKIRLGSLLYLSGNRFLHTECVLRPLPELCGAFTMAYEFDEYQKAGGIGDLERREIIGALTEEATAMIGAASSLVLFQVGPEDGNEPLSPYWCAALLAQAGVQVVAQCIERRAGRYRIVGSKLPHIVAAELITVRIDGQRTWITRALPAEKAGKPTKEVSITNWLSP